MRAKIITLKRARVLRATMTEPEVMLWSRLRRRMDDAPVFRRQHAIGPYILDFFCPPAKLAIEVDGAVHGEERQYLHDQRRDAWLTARGIMVYRIPASEVFADVDEIAHGVRLLADQLIARRSGRPLRQSLCGD